MVSFRGVGIVCAALVVIACGTDRTTAPTDVNAHVVGEAARNLDGHGRFVLPGGEADELTKARAIDLATAYVRVGARWIGDTWERDRGARIDFGKLSACSRVYYAKSALDLRGRGSASLRQFAGSKWLVSFCSPNGTEVLSIAVSAESTDLQVVDGHIVGVGGMQFTSAGLPTTLAAVPLGPEDAVRIVAAATGQRVTDVPELVLPPSPYPPQLAKWRVRLEAPVQMRGARSGVRRATREVYIGFGETWKSSEFQLGNRDAASRELSDAAAGARVTIPVLPGYPTSFERATVEQL